MTMKRISILIIISCLTLTVFAEATPPTYSPWHNGEALGKLDLPSYTTNHQAQKLFETGLKSYYNYEFAQARYAFQEAQSLEPSFTMAYVGEILSDYMFVWGKSYPESAHQAYLKMQKSIDPSKLSKMEQLYVEAVKALSQPSAQTDQSNIKSFFEIMKKAHKAFPKDQEFATLLAHAVLGLRYGIMDFDANDYAGFLLKEVLQRNPLHPGAMHLTLHAFENPVQSPRAITVALKYGLLVKDSIHAQHMPAHYFFPQGNWTKVITVDDYAWQQSQLRQTQLQLPLETLDFHSLSWVIYALQQQGLYSQALERINYLAQLAEAPSAPTEVIEHYIQAKNLFRIDAPPLYQIPLEKLYTPPLDGITNRHILAATHFSKAYIAFVKNSPAKFEKHFTNFKKASETLPSNLSPAAKQAIQVMQVELEGINAVLNKALQQGLIKLRKACLLEDRAARTHGLPLIIKPSHELLGDVLMISQRPYEASYHYRQCQEFYVNRRHCLSLSSPSESLSLSARTAMPAWSLG